MRRLLPLTRLSACLAEGPVTTAPRVDAPAAAPATAPKAMSYGRVTQGPTVTPSAVLADIDGFAGKAVRLEGTATKVCERAGCWMDVADANASIRIKVRDGEVVFPIAARGRRVVAEGTIVKIPLDPAKDPAACGGGHEPGHDCARPAGATARLDGVGATVFDAT